MQYQLTPTTVHPIATDDVSIVPNIPVGVYYVESVRGAFFLKKSEHFTRPTKMYGDVDTRAERILNTFAAREKSTGVLLSGAPGTGKTLLAREVCIRAIETGIPVLIVTSSFGDDILGFIEFCRDLTKPVVFLFDEFEKTFDENGAQLSLLSLFDGTDYHKKLYLLTSNDADQITFAMQSRPGRIFYHFQFDGLDPDYLKQYLDAELTAVQHREAIDGLLSVEYSKITFDCLQALVEEVNRYNESPRVILNTLNIAPTTLVYIEIVVASKTGKYTYDIVRHDINTSELFSMSQFEVQCNPTNTATKTKMDRHWIVVPIQSLIAKTAAKFIFELQKTVIGYDMTGESSTDNGELRDDVVVTMTLSSLTGQANNLRSIAI